MKTRLLGALILIAALLALATPVHAQGTHRAWQSCNGVTQFGPWQDARTPSYTATCAAPTNHGALGTACPCYLWYQQIGSGWRTATLGH